MPYTLPSFKGAYLTLGGSPAAIGSNLHPFCLPKVEARRHLASHAAKVVTLLELGYKALPAASRKVANENSPG